MPDDQIGIPLADAIQSLRQELTRAMRRASGETLQFRLKPVEIEFELGVTRTSGGSVGARFWVFEIGGKTERERHETHKVKLVLEPVGHGGDDVLVGDERPEGPVEEDPR